MQCVNGGNETVKELGAERVTEQYKGNKGSVVLKPGY